jgi:GntP family gluconate:H+ symporter
MSIDEIRIIIGLATSILFMVLWPRYTRLNPFFSLLIASFLFSVIAGIAPEKIIPIMQEGFGSLLQQIGMVVALGSVLGIVLERTGAMESISTSLAGAFGDRRPVLALAVIGALVGIPVFCDSGFIVLSRLIPALAAKTAASQGSLVLALSSGLYTTHTLVPPTPGPLAAAATVGLGDQLGTMILIGLLGSIPVVLVSYLFASRSGRRIVPVPSEHTAALPGTQVNAVRAFLPLVLPIILIAAGSFGKLISADNPVVHILSLLGIPVVALLIGVLLAMSLIDSTRHKDWPAWITEAIKDAGVIILITGAGGAFGAIIKASGIATHIAAYASGSQMQGALFLAFAWLIAAILKTSQGSSTSSMIITSSLLAPLAMAAGIITPVDLSLLVLAIGGGAMGVSHANDSYFWVVSQFGNISEKDAFRWYTPMTLLQSITALIAAIILFLVL